jgi:acylphosphatase
MKTHLNITITGKVHMVGFRFHTRNQAKKLGLMGFVQNQDDGSVYMEIEGEKGKVEELLAWCKQGPQYAQVENVEHKESKMQDFKEFEIN